jgi:hypothetical protein
MTNIYSQLSRASKGVIQSLEKQGWEFLDDSWEYIRKGDEYKDVRFKSPNMRRFASIPERHWKEVSLEYLLEREAHHAANDWASDVFHYTSVVTNPVTKELKEHFLKTKNSKFSPLYASSAEFDVKVSPNIANNTPRKVKVTIEII